MADLPIDLLCVVGYKLDTAGDRIRFRAVSKSWRAALPFRQPPWLMLLKDTIIEFVTAGEQTVSKIDTSPPDILPRGANPVLGCAGLWLIIHFCGGFSLLNPFPKLHFHRQISKYLGDFRYYTTKVVLSSTPRDCGDVDFIAVASLQNPCRLAILRPGDAWWSLMPDCPSMDNGFDDVIFYRGRPHAITNRGKLFAWDIGSDALEPPKLAFVTDCFVEESPGEGSYYLVQGSYYLVEWCGELLVVARIFNITDEYHESFKCFRYETKTFKAYKFDFANMKFEELKSLGDYSLFLGINTSVAVAAADYFGLVRRNCIYFMDDWAGAIRRGAYVRITTEFGVFDMEDDSIKPHFQGASTPSWSKSVWVIPSYQT